MTGNLQRHEASLLVACLALLLLACWGPVLVQPAQFHAYADQRPWLAIPHALNVLSNLPLALGGLAGGGWLWRLRAASTSPVQRACAALFFGGLVLTAAGSGWYHWAPDDAALALDRHAMAVAFAGLLGLAVAERISARAGYLMAVSLLVLGPASVGAWSLSGNVLPWGVLQFGCLALLLWLARLQPLEGALAIRWGWVILIYAVAKAMELADHQVYELTGQALSGHSLKHLIASLAAWPVIAAIRCAGLGAAPVPLRLP